MSSRKMKRAAEAVPVPQNMDQANAALAEIGEARRKLTVIQAAMEEAVTDVTAKAEAEAQPLHRQIEALTRGLQVFAEANRDLLTDQGKRKTAVLGAGELGWRTRPPSVRVGNLKSAIGWLISEGGELLRFIRTKHELDKEAMLKEPEAAKAVPGITIGSGGEEFFVQPLTQQLAPAVAS